MKTILYLLGRGRLLVALPLGGLLLAGCGGNANSVGPPVSTFVGTYSGAWNRPLSEGSAAQNGTLTMTIASDGFITGTSTNNVRGNGIVDSQISYVQAGGQFQILMSYTVSGFPAPISDAYIGTLKRDSSGRLKGTLRQNGGDFTYSVSFDLQQS